MAKKDLEDVSRNPERPSESLEDKVPHDRSNLIETILGTLYARGARGYSISDKVLDIDAVKLIKQEIDKLHSTHRKHIKDDAEYRLERFKEFLDQDKSLKEEVVRLAREQHISLEEAYRIASEERK